LDGATLATTTLKGTMRRVAASSTLLNNSVDVDGVVTVVEEALLCIRQNTRVISLLRTYLTVWNLLFQVGVFVLLGFIESVPALFDL
jgi:hypothetical protein